MTSTTRDERRIKLTLHYDGAAFRGWQVQPGLRTVQGEVEAALSRLLDRPTRATAAGRTDSGVHATGQVVSATVPAKWAAPALRTSLNAVLPADLWVAAAEEVPTSFHARHDAIGRRYIYRLGLREDTASPFRNRWCWPLGHGVDPSLLDRAAAALVGNRSFRAFAKAGQPQRGYRCIVHHSAWRAWEPVGVVFDVTANRFLHHMVRYLVGTMVDIARGRRPAEDMTRLLDGASDIETSAPAPPEGLFLARVYYSTDEMKRESGTDEDLP